MTTVMPTLIRKSSPLTLRRRVGTTVNDVHSRLNPTRVREVVKPTSVNQLCNIVRAASGRGEVLTFSGTRHAMGGQQFLSGGTLLDLRGLNQVLSFDSVHKRVTAEAGICWPDLVGGILEAQRHEPEQWSIAQKQTGADHLTLGGALSANVHGRGLTMRPLVSDIESFQMINPQGEIVNCSRTQNSELFRLAIGGYGLFGCIYSVTLNLVQRQKLQRVVALTETDGLMQEFQEKVEEGFTYGDFQFAIDPKSPEFLRRGVFSCYRPVPDNTRMSASQKSLREEDFLELLYLAHTRKSEGFKKYADFYLSTSGQVYMSDLHQLGTYIEDYHSILDEKLGCKCGGSEMISELYVPRERLAEFMSSAAHYLRRKEANVIYGTVRLIEKDEETFLPWARQDYACVIFNLHVDHTVCGRLEAAEHFRWLIDCAISHDGSYYLTYHKWATREQVLACYPQFPAFLEAKRKYDPNEAFQSAWYRHYREML